jgi:YVTN family beta-propeller protein
MTGSSPTEVSTNQETNTVYVTDFKSQVIVIDANVNAISANITVGKNPDGVSIDPLSDKIYVANSGDGTVTVIDGKTNTVSATISVGIHVYGIAVNPSTGLVYVGNDSPGIVYVISNSERSLPTNHNIFEDIVQFFSHLFNLK